MKDKFFYLFLFIWISSFFVTKPFNLINLIVLGIFLKLILEKQKGPYSTWTLIIAIGIVSCNLLIGLGMMFGLIRL